MKKLLCLLLVILCGCQSNVDTSTGKFISEVKEYTDVDETLIDKIGTEIGEYEFESYNEFEGSLPTGKNYVIEVAGTWCNHCSELTEELRKLDIDVVQYFMYRPSKEEIDAFYTGKEQPDFPSLYNSPAFDNYIESLNINAVPLLIYVGSDNKIKLITIGSDTADNIQKIYDLTFGK